MRHIRDASQFAVDLRDLHSMFAADVVSDSTVVKTVSRLSSARRRATNLKTVVIRDRLGEP